jgi:hypothetical protein
MFSEDLYTMPNEAISLVLAVLRSLQFYIWIKIPFTYETGEHLSQGLRVTTAPCDSYISSGAPL